MRSKPTLGNMIGRRIQADRNDISVAVMVRSAEDRGVQVEGVSEERVSPAPGSGPVGQGFACVLRCQWPPAEGTAANPLLRNCAPTVGFNSCIHPVEFRLGSKRKSFGSVQPGCTKFDRLRLAIAKETGSVLSIR
jgi:hypothetical protein